MYVNKIDTYKLIVDPAKTGRLDALIRAEVQRGSQLSESAKPKRRRTKATSPTPPTPAIVATAATAPIAAIPANSAAVPVSAPPNAVQNQEPLQPYAPFTSRMSMSYCSLC